MSMVEWWQHHTVKAIRRGQCSCCGKISNEDCFIAAGWQYERGGERLVALQVCRTCERYEAALLEALDEGRPLVKLSAWSRCMCGNAALESISECWECAKERRMLDRRLREIKLARRVLRQLRSEVRSVKSE